MDKHRLITLYPRRVTIGKADDLVDGWRTLEFLRVLANSVWARRAAIPPSYDMKSKPPALEIYKRLPRTNCKACGERTCMAFAIRLWRGEATPSQCEPVFTPEYAGLRSALIEICRGLGVVGAEVDAADV
jgi:ArsR family metal-binding transcriptional regulator